MFQPLSAFIGLRYSQSRSRKGFVSFITFFSIAGILLGVASLITVVSVMNGFEGELKKRVLGLIPHVIIETEQPFEQVRKSLLAYPEISNVTPFEQTEALIQSTSTMSGILVQGVNPDIENSSIVEHNMVVGNFSSLAEKGYNVVIGQALANKLNVTMGDKLRIILPNKTLFTPMGRVPVQRTFNITGIFNVGSQVDDAVVYVSHIAAQKLLRKRSSEVGSARLYLNDAFAVDMLLGKLAANESLTITEITSWKDSQGSLFAAVKMEKNMMWLMLSLIVGIAAFNIVSALIMVVNDKQGEISILQTMGMDKAGIIQVFITQGVVNGTWGVALGTVTGLAMTFGLNPALSAFGINIFGPGYVSQVLPIQLEWLDVGVIVISAFAMSFLATLYPAYRASTTLPAEVLRNE